MLYSPHVTTATQYPDSETRGQLRLWKQRVARRYRRFENNGITSDDTGAFMHKRGVGRRRVFDKMVKALGPAVTLEGLRLDGDSPLAVWSILKPRDSLRVTDDDMPSESDCVTVDYVLIGVMPDPRGIMCGVATGVWTIEFTDHALGRVMQRSPAKTPLESIIAEAHHNVLRLRAATVCTSSDSKTLPEFLLRAGSGGFICRVLTGGWDISVNEPMFQIQARTWISDDMKHDDQVLLVADGLPGERLVDGWLLPQPVRRLDKIDGKLHLSTWVKGLPDLLATPTGRA
jgi:hypothetical protein